MESNVHCDPMYFTDYLLEGKKILAVEDNKISMQVLCKSLGELGKSTLRAEHGKEALEIYSENTDIGLVLLDMEMSVMDGEAYMDEVNALFSTPPFAVVLVSELSDWKKAKKLISQGFRLT